MMRETVDWLTPNICATCPWDLPSILTHWKIRCASPSGFYAGAGDELAGELVAVA